MEPKRFADGSGMRDEGECEALGFLSWATGWEHVPEMEELAEDIDVGDREGIKGYALEFLHSRGQWGSGQLTNGLQGSGRKGWTREVNFGGRGHMKRGQQVTRDEVREKAASGTDPCHVITCRHHMQRSCKDRKWKITLRKLIKQGVQGKWSSAAKWRMKGEY